MSTSVLPAPRSVGDPSLPNRATAVALSVVIPARDEAESLPALYERLCGALGDGLGWELLLVDDASSDGTWRAIAELSARDARVRGARLARHSGQSAATFLGVDRARGGLIATLDADLQNDPADLPRLIEALGPHDAVVGFRVGRKDGVMRLISSRIANAIRNRVSGDRVTDTGCSLKLFRAEAIRAVPRFDGMHRFLPTLLRYRGASVVELPVSHHPRLAGRSKYGIRDRAFRGLLDLLAVRWMRSRLIQTVAHEQTEESDS